MPTIRGANPFELPNTLARPFGMKIISIAAAQPMIANKPFTGSALQTIERFEEAWRESPYPNLQKWLKSAVESMQVELAIELCAIDLEWRWRLHAVPKWSRARAMQKAFSITPFAEDYQALLGEMWQAQCQRLKIVEWGVRNLWGDRPDTDSFQSMLEAANNWKQQLELYLDSLLPLDATVQRRGNQILHIKLPARFEIGRQRKDEPRSPAWIKSSSRILIAESVERTVSRTQVQARRTRRGEIEIANAAGSYCVPAGLNIVEPNQIARCPLPAELSFGEILISIREAVDAG